MPQNPIQFQHGMSLSEFIEQVGTDAKCEAALERARWPSGFICPECGEHEHSMCCRRRSALLTVLAQPCANERSFRLTLPCLQAASDQVVPGDLPGDQELRTTSPGAVAHALPRRRLLHRLAGQAQAARSHDPA